MNNSGNNNEDNYFAGVGAIVIRNNRVLLVRHTYGAAVGKLLNPGGYMKKGEMPYDAIKREVLEETGVVISPVGMLSVRCSPKDWYMVFFADYLSGEPVSDGTENSEALFMECDEALSRTDITDTAKRLIGLALQYAPIKQTDAGKDRVIFETSLSREG